MFLYISAVWGSSFILMKRAELCYPAMTLASFRMLSAAAILIIFWLLSKRIKPFEAKDGGHILLLSVLTIIPYSIQPYLISLYGSAFIGMMVILVPLLTILVSLPMLKKSPVAKEVTGVAGGLVFAWVLVYDGIERNLTSIDLILAFLIPLCYAVGNVYTKKKLGHISPLNLSLSVMIIAGLILLPLALSLENIHYQSEYFTLSSINLLILGILGTGIPVIFFFALINSRGPLFAGMVTYLIPIGAILWGVYDGETITLTQITAISGLIFMVALVQWGKKRQTKTIVDSKDKIELPR